MEPVLLARLLCATVIAGVFSASGVASTDPDARSVSCLVRHRRFTGEETSREMVNSATVERMSLAVLICRPVSLRSVAVFGFSMRACGGSSFVGARGFAGHSLIA